MSKSFNIKNYTSGVPASKSVSRIEELLVSMGAQNINKSYKDGQLYAISFLVDVNGNTVPFKLPAKVDQVNAALKKSYKRLTSAAIRNINEQSERTAWKICSDWVEIQATIIKLQQAEFIEVFLPYVYKVETDQTFFESLKAHNYKALLK
jgi:hypothetical protein